METLSDRRWHRRIIQIYKIQNKITPNDLKNNLSRFLFYVALLL